MEIDPTRMCELLVGLPDVDVVGVEDVACGPLRVQVRCRERDRWCRECGVRAESKDRPKIELVDLPAFGRRTRLVWHKYRWQCPEPSCPRGSWIQTDHRIALPHMVLTDRAARWACEQVGRPARSVNEVATELGCDWHTPQRGGHHLQLHACRSPRLRPSARSRCCSFAQARIGVRTSPPNSSMLSLVSSSTLSLVAAQKRRVLGLQPKIKHGVTVCGGPPWTCPEPTGRCPTRCCHTRSKSLIRSTWSNMPTPNWMNVGAVSTTRQWAIAGGRLIRSTNADTC